MGAERYSFVRGANRTKSTGLLSSSGVIKATPGVLVDMLVYTDGTNNATLTIYNDPDSANGTELGKIIVKGTELMGGEVSIVCDATLGMYAEISGTGATYLVRYA